MFFTTDQTLWIMDRTRDAMWIGMRVDGGGMALTEVHVSPGTRRGVTCHCATFSAYSER
jgi:hypothetical protein